MSATIADVQSEAIAVAGLLHSTRLADEVLLSCTADSFTDRSYRAVYEAAGRLRSQSLPIDTLILHRELRGSGAVLGLDSLARMQAETAQREPSATLWHARQLMSVRTLARLSAAGERIQQLVLEARADEAIPQAMALIQAIADDTPRAAELISLAESAYAVWADLKSGKPPGTPTGYADLDAMTGGWHAGDLNLLAARPGCGKTAFALNLGGAVAAQGVPVFFSTLEMSHKQLTGRLLANASGVNGQSIRLHAVQEHQMDYVARGVEQLAELPITLYDRAAVKTSDLRSRVAVWRSKISGPAMLIVDYLQLMRGEERRRDGRAQEVGEISKTLKAIARDNEIPVLALSQLNRNIEGRTSHVPLLSDLRESGDLEQDADMVLFIHRDEVYDPNTDKKGIAEIHIAKQRNGAVGIIPLRFDPETTTFSTLSYRGMEGYS